MEEKVFITIDGSGVRVRLSNGTTEVFKPEEIQTINIVEEGPRVILNTTKGFRQYTSKQSYDNLLSMATQAKERQESVKGFEQKVEPTLETNVYPNQGLYYQPTQQMSGAVKLFLGLFFLMFFLITIVPFLMVLLFFIISIVFTPYSTTPQTTTYYPENTATPNEYYSQNPVIGEALKEGNYGELITLKLNDAVKMKNTIYTSSYLKFTGIGEDSFSYYQQNQSQTPNASFFLFEDNKISITTSLQEKESTKQLFPQLTDIIYLQEIHKEATQAESYTVITKEPRDLVYPNIDKDTLQIYEWRKLTPNTLSPASCEDLCDAKAVCAYEGNPNDLSCRRTITSFGQEYPLNFYTCSGGTVAEEDKNSFYCCCRK